MMAATLASGTTVLENAAREPEIQDLAALLNKMGANIEGAGSDRIVIKGVSRLRGAEHRIIPDRIETGTFLVAAAITGGRLTLTNCGDPSLLAAVTARLSEVGVLVKRLPSSSVEGPEANALEVQAGEPLRASDMTTQEYPGFPTDMQAQYMALMTQAEGSSVITETIFENRFLHALELGAHGRGHLRQRPEGSGQRAEASQRDERAGFRSSRQRLPGPCRPRRSGRNPHRSRLPH